MTGVISNATKPPKEVGRRIYASLHFVMGEVQWILRTALLTKNSARM